QYLVGVGQDQGSIDAPPQFAKAYATYDASINYDVTENLTVFVEGVNLSNETEEIFGRYQAQFLRASQYGTRYAIGARYSF
ncbi:MAG: TonB-dependent receptor, partial [Psychrosphaera sp.]|nr:TonB-dependent receptor [Psychrosphaera sp.]